MNQNTFVNAQARMVFWLTIEYKNYGGPEHFHNLRFENKFDLAKADVRRKKMSENL